MINKFLNKLFNVPYNNTSQYLQNPYYSEVYGMNKWVEIGNANEIGSVRNGYYDYLISLYCRSITHSKIIDLKADMIKGSGFNDLPDELLYFNNILDKISNDISLFGSFTLKINWDRKSMIDPSHKRLSSIEYIPVNNIRLGNTKNDKTKDKIYLCDDWLSYGNNKSKIYEYNKFSTDFEDIRSNPIQILYSPYKLIGNAIYGAPLYGYQTDIFEIAYEIPKFHITGLKKGAFANLHIHNSNGIGTTEQQEEFISGFIDMYNGTQGARTYFTFGEDETHKVEINPIDIGISDEKFIKLWDKNTEAIFEAHGIDMELLTGKKDGALINRDNTLEIIEKTQVKSINSIQRYIENTFKLLYPIDFKINKYEINLRRQSTTTKDIVDIISLNVDDNIKIELLKESGVLNPERFLPTPSSIPSKLNDPINNEQLTIINQIKSGKYTEDEGVSLLINGFGLTKDEAINLIKNNYK